LTCSVLLRQPLEVQIEHGQSVPHGSLWVVRTALSTVPLDTLNDQRPQRLDLRPLREGDADRDDRRRGAGDFRAAREETVTQTHRPTTADVIAWFKDERARREAAEARIAALEAALRQLQDCIGDVLAGCRDPAHRGRD
jgi:hypothetical protein